MTVPEPWPADGPRLSEEELERPRTPAPLHQPWRGVVAAAEVVVAVLLVLLAWWVWGKAAVSIPLPVDSGVADASTRLIGSRIGMAVAVATLAGLLVLDAGRHAVLAVRTRTS
ncbi:hypothetical protein HUO13_34930 [Saccharopolyspora erythraea]|uniref:hypothetical protein n=1 Tax=Saccharopolyspora erythraea TaxID=1836 RepID=UPI001BA4E891|nr:hypothetical protein [Saccharopolyspora erythraea]QUH05283.1 hypothetical protein HUO13_34930 [Saccharopolyspora erythraea]